MRLRVVSYGGGVQSTALLVLAARSVIDFPVFLFSNVGDDSEHPDTITYVHSVAMPYAAEHGIKMHELHRVMRGGTRRTLLQDLSRDSRTINIPVRMANGAPGHRSCTADYKIKVISKWLKAHGATEYDPAVVAIGFSTDEIERSTNRIDIPTERVAYPLLDLGINRGECETIIRRAGLPVPPKSACWFCPFHRPSTWAEMRRDEPELFWRSVGAGAAPQPPQGHARQRSRLLHQVRPTARRGDRRGAAIAVLRPRRCGDVRLGVVLHVTLHDAADAYRAALLTAHNAATRSRLARRARERRMAS